MAERELRVLSARRAAPSAFGSATVSLLAPELSTLRMPSAKSARTPATAMLEESPAEKERTLSSDAESSSRAAEISPACRKPLAAGDIPIPEAEKSAPDMVSAEEPPALKESVVEPPVRRLMPRKDESDASWSLPAQRVELRRQRGALRACTGGGIKTSRRDAEPGQRRAGNLR